MSWMRLIQTSFWISNNADDRRIVVNLDAVVEYALYVYRRVGRSLGRRFYHRAISN